MGDPIIDVAVANLDTGSERDVYFLNNLLEVWRFNLQTGHLVQEFVDGIATSIAAIQAETFGFTDAVYYGTDDGHLRQLGDSSLDAKVP